MDVPSFHHTLFVFSPTAQYCITASERELTNEGKENFTRKRIHVAILHEKAFSG